jgi:hypothetical protein
LRTSCPNLLVVSLARLRDSALLRSTPTRALSTKSQSFVAPRKLPLLPAALSQQHQTHYPQHTSAHRRAAESRKLPPPPCRPRRCNALPCRERAAVP